MDRLGKMTIAHVFMQPARCGRLAIYPLLFIMLMGVTGCSSLSYYLDMIGGHLELISKERDISEMIRDETTDKDLREKLIASQAMRDFASSELALPDNDSYRSYADIGRAYAVWNVIAAKEFSIDAERWCFIFAGCISYRGYFSEQDAKAYADELAGQGFDVYVAGARAYSTLGWFDDPLLNTMMYRSEAYRAGIIFHELAHQKIYIEDDSAFNEAFATTIEQEGIRRWFSRKNQQHKLQAYMSDYQRNIDFRSMLKETREKLDELYKKKEVNDEIKREEKKAIFKKLSVAYLGWKQQHGNYTGYDSWMAQGLNNAHLALIATYHEMVPGFTRLLEKNQNDLDVFYNEVEKLGKLSIAVRKQSLLQ